VIALRIAAAACGATMTLLAGAWAGGALAPTGIEDAARAAREERTPADGLGAERRYPRGMPATTIGESLEVSGLPMQLSVFQTPDPPQRVVAFYADAFRARGLLPVVSSDPSFAHAAAFDPADGLQRFVGALASPADFTMAVVGTVDRRRLPAADARPSFPLPEGHRPLLSYRSTDGAAQAESAQFLSGWSTSRIAAFYREVLARSGYAQVAGAPDGHWTFEKAGATVSLAARPLPAGAGSVAFVTRIERSAP
jgi:hypothetical protein